MTAVPPAEAGWLRRLRLRRGVKAPLYPYTAGLHWFV